MCVIIKTPFINGNANELFVKTIIMLANKLL